LIYSDGLTDALPSNEANAMAFGVNGIIKTLQGSGNEPLDQTLNLLFRDSNAYTEGAGRHDDTSVVLVERRNL
jgi:serine phosphatase RsbU (regulator of sigma subunit)